MTAVTPLIHDCITHADPSLNIGSTVNILALMPPATLRQAVIRPALSYLGITSRSAENLLLGTLMVMAWLPHGNQPHGGIGPFGISRGLHTHIWDDYLARDPEVASLIRGLASQRCFLQNPHAELGYNLAYATAIAWLVYQQQPLDLSENIDINELAQLWYLIYPHRGGSAMDFIECWNQANHDESAISV